MGWFRRREHDEEQLSAYLDGELDARQSNAVERHLASCDPCRALLEEMRETRSLLRNLPAEAPSRSFVLGPAYENAPARPATPPRRPALAFAPAAALVVFVALLFVDAGGFSTSSSDEAMDTIALSSMEEAPAVGYEAAPGMMDAPDSAGTETGDANSDTPQPELRSASPEPGTTDDEMAPPSQDGVELETFSESDAPPAEMSPQPMVREGGGDDSGGISTLRLLQAGAFVALLASGFYVFVWPRIARPG